MFNKLKFKSSNKTLPLIILGTSYLIYTNINKFLYKNNTHTHINKKILNNFN
jgi:hypothetical protein